MSPFLLAAAAVAAPRAPLWLLGRGLAAAMSTAGPLKSVDYEVFGRVQGRDSATAGEQAALGVEGKEAETRALLPSWPGLPLGRDTAAAAGTRGNAQAPGSCDGRGEEQRTGKGKGGVPRETGGTSGPPPGAGGRNEVGQENKREPLNQ